MQDQDVSVSFWVRKGEKFTVEVKCWKRSATKWAWNVYAHVFEGHPLYANPNDLMSGAPLSGGCTFDQEKTTMPIGGPKYDSQKINRSITVGSDYKHIWDEDYSHCGPESGIPRKIECDALELAEWLENSRDHNNGDDQ